MFLCTCEYAWLATGLVSSSLGTIAHILTYGQKPLPAYWEQSENPISSVLKPIRSEWLHTMPGYSGRPVLFISAPSADLFVSGRLPALIHHLCLGEVFLLQIDLSSHKLNNHLAITTIPFRPVYLVSIEIFCALKSKQNRILKLKSKTNESIYQPVLSSCYLQNQRST
jgi:hypothetical protein